MRYVLFLMITMLISGCSYKSLVKVNSFDEGVYRISEDIFDYRDMNQSRVVIFTSIVNIDDLKHSSKFGRLFAESLMTDFKLRGWRIKEYRGTDIVTLNEEGEFMLNRARLKEIDEKALVFVGTYGLYSSELVVNCRLIDTDEVVSAASVKIHDLESVKMAYNLNDLNQSALDLSYKAEVVEDDCSDDMYCWKDVE